jgi:hypothetical protein
MPTGLPEPAGSSLRGCRPRSGGAFGSYRRDECALPMEGETVGRLRFDL